MSKNLKAAKEHNVKLLSCPKITESGVYDAIFKVNGEVVEREFEVGISALYDYVAVTAVCCNEEDEDVAGVMECKLEEAIEWYIRSR